MTNRLSFTINYLPHPYRNEPSASFECWGRLLVSIIEPSGTIQLLDTQWDLLLLVEWFAINCGVLCNQQLLLVDSIQELTYLTSESLAEALNRLQNRDFDENEEIAEEQWFSSLYEFRKRHALRMILKGADISNIIIGINHGVGEISVADENNHWCYLFDINDFCEHFKLQAARFIADCLINATSAEMKNQIDHLLKQMENCLE